jgi:1,4-dihydroxy-2-naphthoate octaprenyltransferase
MDKSQEAIDLNVIVRSVCQEKVAAQHVTEADWGVSMHDMNTPRTPPTGWRLYLQMTRPGFLSVTAVGVIVGLASAAACGCGFNALKAVATLVLALFAHAGANVLNDYFDSRNGADAANQQGLYPFSGGSRLIQNGVVSEQDTLRWALVLLAVVVPGGLLLALKSGGGLLLVGAAGLLLAWAYSAPPFKLMSRGLGEVAVAASWWVVVVGADYTQRGQWFVISAFCAVSYALLVGNILLINGVPDAVADASVGKRTLATRMSPRAVAWLYLAVLLAAHGWLALGVWALIPPITALWALLALVPGLTAAWLLFRWGEEPQRLRPAVGLTIATAVVHGVGLSVGLMLPRWL